MRTLLAKSFAKVVHKIMLHNIIPIIILFFWSQSSAFSTTWFPAAFPIFFEIWQAEKARQIPKKDVPLRQG